MIQPEARIGGDQIDFDALTTRHVDRVFADSRFRFPPMRINSNVRRWKWTETNNERARTPRGAVREAGLSRIARLMYPMQLKDARGWSCADTEQYSLTVSVKLLS
jgi:hypothetical protein